ncbi:MAG: hypothetical protein AB7U35_00360 [Sphingobium sp.]
MTDIDNNDTLERPLSTTDLARSETSPVDRQGQIAREETPGKGIGEDTVPLFPSDRIDGLRNRWQEVQASFVDEPRRAVEQADELVAGAMKTLAEVFADERANLESQWDRGEDISTEDLRVALQRYRIFFGRLLAL